jgi:hypothetical protein
MIPNDLLIDWTSTVWLCVQDIKLVKINSSEDCFLGLSFSIFIFENHILLSTCLSNKIVFCINLNDSLGNFGQQNQLRTVQDFQSSNFWWNLNSHGMNFVL